MSDKIFMVGKVVLVDSGQNRISTEMPRANNLQRILV
tara:strand:+ start:165 stop:275 length:111 start_codon:yes stop_codon:yes gene_type:complete